MFKRGDKVTFLNETGEAEFLELIDANRALVMEEGLEHIVSIHELILKDRKDGVGFIPDNNKVDQHVNKSNYDNGKKPADLQFDYASLITSYLSRSRQHWTRKRQHFAEIDLHLEELVPFPNRVEPWRRIEIQLQFCQGMIEAAMDGGIHHLVFIHGRGEGRLKDELIKLLKTYSNIEYESAPFEFYGVGALDVYIRGLNS